MIPYNSSTTGLLPEGIRRREVGVPSPGRGSPASRFPRSAPIMSLSVADVRRIARLARLALSDEEAVAAQTKLSSVFGLIERLQAVDTEGVEPMTHPQPMTLRLRADEVTESDRRADFQAVAPAVEQGLYLVPRVIE